MQTAFRRQSHASGEAVHIGIGAGDQLPLPAHVVHLNAEVTLIVAVVAPSQCHLVPLSGDSQVRWGRRRPPGIALLSSPSFILSRRTIDRASTAPLDAVYVINDPGTWILVEVVRVVLITGIVGCR